MKDLSYFYKNVELIMTVHDQYTSKKLNSVVCVDNIGQGTSALNATSLSLAYIQQMAEAYNEGDVLLLTSCISVD